MFKSIHNTHKIGCYWLKIENFNKRSLCPTCNEEETLDHILTECQVNTRTEVWEATRNTWPYDESLWPPITPGTILGCGLLEINTIDQSAAQNQEEHPNEPSLSIGATRLARILISEAAYLVWTLRCGRVINGRTYTNKTIKMAWCNTINRRLAEDVTTATKIVRRDDHTKLIHNTWYRALRKTHRELTEDWIKQQPQKHF